jgi:hypothetical protein
MRMFGRRNAAPAAAVLAVALLATLSTAVGGGPATAATGAAPDIEIGEASNEVLATIEIIDAASRSLGDGDGGSGDGGSGDGGGGGRGDLAPPGTSEPMYVPSDLVTDTSWTAESATVPDRTTNPRTNFMTPRTSTMFESAVSEGVVRLSAVHCVSGRAANPNSDHPGGRACDFMFDPHSATAVSNGWRAANWLVANQAALGVKYVIWQGMMWNARSRPGPWTTYNSSAYGCPNPANLTGCHYDHVHVSMY